MISASDQNPNIVVFFVDDMGHGEEDLQQHNSQLEARLAISTTKAYGRFSEVFPSGLLNWAEADDLITSVALKAK